jgi:PHP family Zn ribbon phosphoesterase
MGNGFKSKLKAFLADLHVHTVLSPCAEIEMIPPLIVDTAIQRGLKIIAITDHNASANVSAVLQAAEGSQLTVIPGMEVQTREEVHALCLFAGLDQLRTWQEIVDQTLPQLENRPNFFGEQFVVDKTGEFIQREHRLLLTSSSLSFEEACQKVHQIGGLFIPAHIDRKSFGLIANLGFVPKDVPIDALEISRYVSSHQLAKDYLLSNEFPILQDGDAHRLDELITANEFVLEAPSLEEIHLAIRHKSGRDHHLRHISN